VEFSSFLSYLTLLPITLSETLFIIFSKNKNYILKSDFITGMITLFSGDEYILLKLFFDLLIPDENILINLENFKQIFRKIYDGKSFEQNFSKMKNLDLLENFLKNSCNSKDNKSKPSYIEFLENFQNSKTLRTLFFEVSKIKI
jgi:hypothetical protein